ncbi:WhiB family transcriptional regulator [Streptomyces sp. NPDC047990]|uniref:WhiB family transcriptional regulator n=1 Tax=Streptomyces sp. NPDC047990 TaxID=3365496 RepID=UPI00371F3D90
MAGEGRVWQFRRGRLVRGQCTSAAGKGGLRGCPVCVEWLAEALDGRIEFGMWGGMTGRDHRVLLRRKPNVAFWLSVLVTVRDRMASHAG